MTSVESQEDKRKAEKKTGIFDQISERKLQWKEEDDKRKDKKKRVKNKRQEQRREEKKIIRKLYVINGKYRQQKDECTQANTHVPASTALI